MVQSIPVNHIIFIQIPLHIGSVRSYVSQFCLNVCIRIETGSTNRRKRVAWDDVTKYFLFHKEAILTNLFEALEY